MPEVEEDGALAENAIESVKENENAPENTETTENPEEAADKPKEVKVKRVRNPQPKLNVERLKGPRGLQMLPKVFADVKFKGRGHEEEDLGVLMKNYEYWCHRLIPKFPLDDSLEKMEKLGTKRELQTYLKRIRMDMVLDDEVTEQNEVKEQQNEVVNEEDNAFDQLLPRQTQTQASDGLTEEQLERIRINRERAQRVRQQMLIRNKPQNVVTTISSQGDSSEITSMDVEDNTNLASQSSIDESFCFQTTAVVHEVNTGENSKVGKSKGKLVKLTSPNSLDDISVVSEVNKSQEIIEEHL